MSSDPIATNSDVKNCLNCDTPVDGEFCKVCGQASSTERYSLSALAQEVYTQLRKVEASKTTLTIWALLIFPGQFVRGYLAGKRVDHINPVRFFFYGFFIEVSVRLAVLWLMPDNPITGNSKGGITAELLNFGLTIVWGLLWSVLYFKEDLNLAEYIVAAMYFVGQTFVLSAAILVLMLPIAQRFESAASIHTIVDLIFYFVYSCFFAYQLFSVRLIILIFKQVIVAFVFMAVIWGLYREGVFELLGLLQRSS